MKIAVVTATITGREEMLARCVYSVAIQTRRPDRHLIGNGDGRPEADVLNELIGGSDCHAYIVLNDDDLLLRTYVEKCVRKLRDADVVYAWPRVEGRPISFNELSVRSVSLPVTALVRKSLYDNIGGYAPKVKTGEWADRNFWRRAFDAGARFAFVPEPLWVYRFHGNNMSV